MEDWLTKQDLPADEFLMLGDGDATKNIYHAYGMPSSILKSWSPATLLFYAKNMLSGTVIEKSLVKEDVHQLGGDFVVGKDGKLLLGHPSTSPIDRVSVSDVMDCLRKAVGATSDNGCSDAVCRGHAHETTEQLMNKEDSSKAETKDDGDEEGECTA